MGRWARENEFDSIIMRTVDSISRAEGPWPIPQASVVAAVKAIIAGESAFNPQAVRGEPQKEDASIGLMQILSSTARSLGYEDVSGTTGLFRPEVNIFFGSKYFHGLLHSTGGNLDAAFSSYNGGYRPRLGFGAKRTPTTPRVCLQWKPTAPVTGRTIDRDCQVIGSTVPGTFSNQSYVDRARNYYAYFFVS